MMSDPLLDLEPSSRATEPPKRRHASVGDAARDDEVEMAEIGRDG